MKPKSWIELDPIYLSDDKRRPIEAVLFFNRCAYNPAAKVPTLRRRTGVQSIIADTKALIEDEVVKFCTRDDVRLLAEGLSANDFHRLPRAMQNPPEDVLNGTAAIYEDVA